MVNSPVRDSRPPNCRGEIGETDFRTALPEPGYID
jgi:hypothetical protein